MDLLKGLEEWDQVLLYLEGLHQSLALEVLQEDPGRDRDVLAAEARMVQRIYNWAASPPETESKEENDG